MSRASRSVVVAALALVAVLVTGDPVGADDPPTSQRRTFRYCGTTTWTVPADVSTMQVTVDGAAGGEGDGNGDLPEPASSGGSGGRTVATIPVDPGETLTVVVGCEGEDATLSTATAQGGAGHGRGGNGGQAPDGFANAGGAGGGGSAVLADGGTTPLVVSGGGGGGGASGSENDAFGGAGGGGGQAGEAGGSPFTCGGGGGTTSDPGAGGDGQVDGAPGDGIDGGDGAIDSDLSHGALTGGGGGGGGHFGGGGGGADRNSVCGGGGGGSGFVIAEATEVTATTGAVDGSGSVAIDFSSLQPAAPANDDDVDAIDFADTIGVLPAVDTTGAGAEVGEPDHAGQPAGHSVWYRFTAPFTGRVRLDTAGSDYDTVLAAYTADLPSRSFTQVAANDDGPTGSTSEITFRVAEGTTYFVAVDGHADASGSAVLAYRFFAPRPDARIRVGATGVLRGNNVFNTLTGQTVNGSARAGRTVVYRATLQNDSALPERLRLRGQGSAARMTIRYRTGAGVNITNKVVNGTFRTPAIKPGGTYLVRIQVTLARNVGPAALNRTLRAFSVVDPTVTDTVRFRTRRR